VEINLTNLETQMEKNTEVERIVIKPTIGRVVWYYEESAQHSPGFTTDQPVPALICYVHSDRRINIGGFDASGDAFSRRFITLIQDGEVVEGGAYACWMPYQKGAAIRDRERIAAEVPTEFIPPSFIPPSAPSQEGTDS
jgi:hypothetical protein